MRLLPASALLLAALACPVSAAVIYNESPSGDLPANPDLLAPFQFTLGINTVSGSLFRSGDEFDFDAFRFTIPSGAFLSAASLEFLATGDLTSEWQFRRDNNGFTHLEYLTGTQNFSATPQPDGLYEIRAFALYGDGSADYTFSFEVVATPEPATFLLLTPALAFLALRRRLPK
jgi:hypothetical protein